MKGKHMTEAQTTAKAAVDKLQQFVNQMVGTGGEVPGTMPTSDEDRMAIRAALDVLSEQLAAHYRVPHPEWEGKCAAPDGDRLDDLCRYIVAPF